MNVAEAADGTRLAWSERGLADGPPLLLVHSLGTNSTMWRPQIGALRDRFRLVLPDLRGHGGSQAPPGPYTLATLGGDVIAVADAAGLDRFHLAGLSIGGQIVLWTGLHHGDRLHSLIVCNTAARIGSAEGWAERIAAVESEGMAQIAPSVVGRWFSDGFAERRPDRFAEAVAAFESTAATGYVGCCHALATADLRDEVSAITVPTLVVGGEVDVSTPPTEAQWLHQQIPGSRLEIIEDAGHLSNLDQPAEFSRRLRRFLS